MLRKTKKGFYVLEKFTKFPELIHGFSTKEFGNMSFARGNYNEVAGNRLKFAKAVGFNPNSVAQMELVHGTNIEAVDKESVGGLVDNKKFFSATDGFISQSLGISLFLVTADCAPVLLYDPQTKTISICHAGMKGAVSGILERVVKKLKDEFNINPKNLVVGIGPSIGPCCYDLKYSLMWREVVKKKFEKFYPQEKRYVLSRGGKKHFDLWGLIVYQLIKSGVKKKNIEVGKICTVCCNDEFFSNFKARTLEKKAREGRLASVIGLKNKERGSF